MSNQPKIFDIISKINEPVFNNSPEHMELFEIAQKGCVKTTQKLVKMNLKLVVVIARSFQSKYGSEFEDLVSVGVQGLHDAIRLFDPSMGYNFSTYGRTWICQKMIKYVKKDLSLTHMPMYMGKNIKMVKDALEENPEASIQDISDKTGLTKKCVRICKDYYVSKSIIYLDESIDQSENDSKNYHDLLIDENSFSSYQECEKKNNISNIYSIVDSCLNRQRDKEIFLRYYSTQTTFAKLGSEYNLSYERIRQICERSMKIVQSTIRKKS